MSNTSILDKQFQAATFEAFLKKNELLIFRSRQQIIYPDETSRGIYYIEKGHVKVYSLTEWGTEKLTIIFKEGEFFPVVDYFYNQPIRHYYESMDTTHIRFLPREALQTFLQNSFGIYIFTSKLIGMMSEYEDRIENLEFIQAKYRLIYRLIYLVKRFGVQTKNCIVIDAPVNFKEITVSTAMTRETVNREFIKLREKGFLGLKGRKICVYDLDKLKAELLKSKETAFLP